VFLSRFGKDQCVLLTNGGTKIGLTLNDVKGLRILLPPLNEQAEILRAIESDTSALNIAITRTERETALMQE